MAAIDEVPRVHTGRGPTHGKIKDDTETVHWFFIDGALWTVQVPHEPPSGGRIVDAKWAMVGGLVAGARPAKA